VDMTLLGPEIWMTLLACTILGVDILWPNFSKRHLAYLAAAGLMLVLGPTLGLSLNQTRGTLFGTMFIIDPLATFFQVFILVSTLLALLASVDAIERFTAFRGEYIFLLLFTALGMMFMVSANDFLSLFITLEFASFGFYILVAYKREDVKSSEAGMKFFILGVLAASLIAYGVSLIYGDTGSILFEKIAQQSSMSLGFLVGLLFVFIGLGFKIGVVPFHAWVPDVYEGAPTVVTAYLSIVPKAAAFALLFRVLFSTLGDIAETWRWMIVAVSVLSMTYGNITAIAQTNMKRLLAYSGIAQIGTLCIGLASATQMGSHATLFYLLAYLFANLGAFIVVIIYSNLTEKDDLQDFAGLNRRSPILAFAMLIFLLSLAGVPPLAGFLAKVYIFAGAVEQGLLFLVSVGLINVIISFYYYLIIVKKMYTLPPAETTEIPISIPMKIALYTCMAGTLLLGIWPAPWIDYAVSATDIFQNMPIR